jgi:predicted RNA-binding protein with PIN domain
MRWLIDGYNVIRGDPDLRGAEAQALAAGRTALLHRVAAVAREMTDHFTVVFDGAVRHGEAPGPAKLEVVFSRPPSTADDVLRRLAAQWKEAAIVVSSDRAVQDGARRAGAVAVSAEAFLAALDRRDREPLDGDAEEDPDDDARRPSGGNPHRPSRAARASERALRRLRGG